MEGENSHAIMKDELVINEINTRVEIALHEQWEHYNYSTPMFIRPKSLSIFCNSVK